MGHYRCYFIAGESIKAAENIEAVDDVGALLKAEELILKCSFLAVEVWKKKDFIGRISIAPDLKVIVGGKYSAEPRRCENSGAAFEGRHVSGYRSYLMSGETIQAVQTYECADDAEVILKAKALLDSKPQHAAVEIWDGKRLVARLTRNPTDEPSQQDNVIRVVKQDN